MSKAKRKPLRDLEHHEAAYKGSSSTTESPQTVYHGLWPFVKRRFSV